MAVNTKCYQAVLSHKNFKEELLCVGKLIPEESKNSFKKKGFAVGV